MSVERIEADYLIETAYEPQVAAETMAGEQSSGTFRPVPGETEELKARAAARVERLEIVGTAEAPSLPTAGVAADAKVTRAQVTLSWPIDNLGPSLPNLMATVSGNLSELKQVSGLRVLDIRLPDVFAEAYQGPQFGVAGTRRLAGVAEGPLIGTIVKPSVGFSPAETAALVKTLAEAGIDFIKDDELQSDGPSCPFEARVEAVMAVIDEVADRTGKKLMYAFNLTGELDQMRRRHDLVMRLGGTCVMASLNSVGLVGFVELRRHAALPIHAHRNGWGYLSRHPLLGWSYLAWQKFWRLAGADHMHVNGLRNKFSEPDESVIASAKECLTPMFEAKPCTVMPVFSSGQTALQAPDTFAAIGTDDLMYLAGGGIMAHPGGPADGLASLRQGWEAAMAGIPLDVYARDHGPLAEAMKTYA
ncbi:ribulose-bisphosphate carboxylase large subunit family protein [Acuticoccus sp. I52.16.1]|uniref:ribulose-bisphosphate carboxylase large subunit family protein n=1 Tax=Acuticoccus sp. I52.16.1 TaxID=2928472 RepID=UPI001FD12BF9|nr:ribulose-bisphosphate carboxylase large subunit family protein [Acuticoccus sp. I52.16.1]UOM36587.1 ribulose-bisphosphate carboxylase large subunit family protein [Acuticoccus sp. I52.16.1]